MVVLIASVFWNKLSCFSNIILQNNDNDGKLLLKSITEVVSMSVNYNNLWKLLIDKGITKTEMRKMAGLSTNVLAKMGKNETVSMETLAKIVTVLNCGFDDIIEIKNEKGI